MRRSGVAVDVGGTKILSAAAADPDDAHLVDTDVGSGPQGVMRRLVAAVRHWDVAPADRVVIATAGHLDLERGRIRDAANLPFRDYPIVATLSHETGCDVELIGDTTAAAVVELTHGHRRRHANGVYVTVSTGIGMGVVQAGRLDWHHGIGDTELGHVQVADGESALPCGCGRRGCLEAHASGASIVRRYLSDRPEPSAAAPGTNAPGPARVTVTDVVRASELGDEVARLVLDDALSHLARSVAGVAADTAASLVVLGGGVMVHSGLFAHLRDRLDDRLRGTVTIESAAFGGLSVLHGAAAVCRRLAAPLEMLGGPWARTA